MFVNSIIKAGCRLRDSGVASARREVNRAVHHPRFDTHAQAGRGAGHAMNDASRSLWLRRHEPAGLAFLDPQYVRFVLPHPLLRRSARPGWRGGRLGPVDDCKLCQLRSPNLARQSSRCGLPRPGTVRPRAPMRVSQPTPIASATRAHARSSCPSRRRRYTVVTASDE